MRYACLLLVALSVMLPLTAAAEQPLVQFDGGIGATPAAIAGGVLVINTTRGVAPGGRPWVIESLRAEVKIDGRVSVEGRGLLLGASATAATVLTTRRGFGSPASDVSVSIDLGKETGTIRPELHGHFAEHLGRCCYDGVWVGHDQTGIPAESGFRRDVVDALR